jgi:hypothetical protein
MMSAQSTLKVFIIGAFAAFGTLVLQGCNPECVDKYDCTGKGAVQADGGRELYTCVDSKCVAGDSGGIAPDAGTP